MIIEIFIGGKLTQVSVTPQGVRLTSVDDNTIDISATGPGIEHLAELLTSMKAPTYLAPETDSSLAVRPANQAEEAALRLAAIPTTTSPDAPTLQELELPSDLKSLARVISVSRAASRLDEMSATKYEFPPTATSDKIYYTGLSPGIATTRGYVTVLVEPFRRAQADIGPACGYLDLGHVIVAWKPVSSYVYVGERADQLASVLSRLDAADFNETTMPSAGTVSSHARSGMLL